MKTSTKDTNWQRCIIHVDMDAFYAAVEALDNPNIKGKPVIVGGCSTRGVVSAASYEARKYGIHSAMPIILARKLCPEGIFLPVRMSRYSEISTEIMAVFEEITPLVEPLSLDEAFLDVTASLLLFGSGVEIASSIKKRIFERTGLTSSAGVAGCKLVAKIASDLQKPNGLTIVPPGTESAFLEPLPAQKLWGVGRKTCQELQLIGIKTIGDIAGMPPEILERKFGKSGRHLHQSAQGIDPRPVQPVHEIKSVGCEETYEQDIRDPAELRKELLALATRVGGRLRRRGARGKTITIKVKYHDFKQETRSVSIQTPCSDDQEIFAASLALLEKTGAKSKPVRLLGISLSNLATNFEKGQLPLFAETKDVKRSSLYEAVDSITARYGHNAIQPALLIDDGCHKPDNNQ